MNHSYGLWENLALASKFKFRSYLVFLNLISKSPYTAANIWEGKSVMTSRIIHFLQQDKQTTILYHFCTYVSSPSTRYGHILRSLVAKLLRGNSDLLAYVYEEYVLDRKTASPTNLEHLILTLLPSLSSERSKVAVRIILDGLDECEEDQQQRIISILDRASRLPTTGTVCKVLVSSRDTPKLTRLLRRKPSISFKDEIAAVSKAIQYYIQKRLNDMKLELLELQITDSQIEYAKNTIVAKSDGMIICLFPIEDTIIY